MYKMTFKCEIITPMFLAGADGRTAELRAPSIKGALRFWWRAMHGHLPLDKLRENEAKIFGGIEKGQEKSAFSISLTGSYQSSLQKFPNHPVKVTSRSKNRTFNINILEYLAYGTLEFKKGFIREYLSPKNRFEVSVSSFDQELLKELKNLFWIMANFGGLGSKSRNGFGNFGIKNIDELALDSFNYATFKNKFKGTPVFSHTGFSNQMRILKTGSQFNTWDQALAEVGKAYLEARRKLEPKHQYEKRQYLGAPIVVGKRTESFLKRRAKPFFIHVQKTSEDKYVGYLFYLPSKYCDGLEKDRNNKPINHNKVNKSFFAYTQQFVNILSGNPNLIELK